MDLPKAYTPRDVEPSIYERWLAADVFAPDGAGSTADPDLPSFTIIQGTLTWLYQVGEIYVCGP